MKNLLFMIIFLASLLGPQAYAMEKEVEEEPKKGWVCKKIDDLGKKDSTCEKCGTKIRYVHTMKHKKSKEQPKVGCCCAAKMEDDESKAQRRVDNIDYYNGKFQLIWDPYPNFWNPMGYRLQKKFKKKTTDTHPSVHAFEDKVEKGYRYNFKGPSKLFGTLAEAQTAAISDFLGVNPE